MIVAAALWAVALTTMGFAFAVDDVRGLFEVANTLALMACVPTFHLIAETMFEHYHEVAQRERVELVGELAEMLGRSDASRDLPRVDHR